MYLIKIKGLFFELGCHKWTKRGMIKTLSSALDRILILLQTLHGHFLILF